MEGRKSFVDELFPRNNEADKTASLSSIFPSRSKVSGKDSEWTGSRRKSGEEGKISTGYSRGSPSQSQNTAKKSGKPLNLYELPESCLMSSSIYYGGRDDFIPQTSATHNSGAHYTYKKNKEDDLGNSEVATRGDWWQGSYYY